jgi:hypothetical protein
MSRGKLNPHNNTLLINQLFVGIRNVRGKLSSVSSASVSLAQSDGAVITARVTGRTEVEAGGRKITGATAHLAEGQLVILIGYRDPSTDALTATRILGSAADAGRDADPEPVATRTSAGGKDPEYDYLTSWFCCGNISSACGEDCSCKNCYTDCTSCSGSCGDCRADYHHMAWAKLSTTNCDYSCCDCCRTIDWRACGYRPYVWNPCQNNTVYTPKVVTCGPCVHCLSTSDCSRKAVVFDVTPCLFTALGAPLSQGIQAINVNAV